MSRNLHNHLVETRYQELDSTSIHLACDDLFEIHGIDCSSQIAARRAMEKEEERTTTFTLKLIVDRVELDKI